MFALYYLHNFSQNKDFPIKNCNRNNSDALAVMFYLDNILKFILFFNSI